MSAQDENLLAQARTGNQEALSELLLKYLPHTEARLRKKFTTALRQWQSFLDIRDILQITAMQALLDFPGFHGHAAQFEHWLGHIAGNDFRDAIRWLESRTPAGTRLQPPEGRNFLEWLWDLVDETGPTPSARLKAQEQREILQQAVQALPVSWASVIRLLFFEEKSIEETAALMKRTPAALYVLRLRALKRLRELLGTQFFSK